MVFMLVWFVLVWDGGWLVEKVWLFDILVIVFGRGGVGGEIEGVLFDIVV